ncbi:phage tail sheath subtilisin-like domain-containing protein [Kiloniella litopenaei]|uniref:phage tail sheath subtilisin-like domain-containing protein n=1 Tax=Kiloniella litopenaei TaxID=1549748 RepID=UPI003BAD7707
MPEQFLHGVEVLELTNGNRPVQTVRSSVIGVIGTAPDADASVFPLNKPVLLINEPTKAGLLGATGTLKDAMEAIYAQVGAVVVVVRVEEGADEAATLTNIVGDETQKSGVHAFKAAETQLKVTPRILIAPGFTSQRPASAANPVISALTGIAREMRSVIFADGPTASYADAITHASDWGSDRVFIIAPGVKAWDRETNAPMVRPASAYAAGTQAWIDNNKGFWWSPSNHILQGVVGTSRPISFGLSDKNTEANLMNENKIATVIHKDGYRLWGNRTTATDPLWAFLAVRRTADLVYDSIENAMLWAMDRPFSAQLLLDIVGTVNAYLRQLKAVGAILGGEAWIDPELNTKENFQAGKLYVDFDIEPAAPMEHLTFRAHRNGDYYEELVIEVQKAIEASR